MSDICIDLNSAEVATGVFLFVRVLPRQVQSSLAVVPQGGAVVPRERQYRPSFFATGVGDITTEYKPARRGRVIPITSYSYGSP